MGGEGGGAHTIFSLFTESVKFTNQIIQHYMTKIINDRLCQDRSILKH